MVENFFRILPAFCKVLHKHNSYGSCHMQILFIYASWNAIIACLSLRQSNLCVKVLSEKNMRSDIHLIVLDSGSTRQTVIKILHKTDINGNKSYPLKVLAYHSLLLQKSVCYHLLTFMQRWDDLSLNKVRAD